MKKSLFTALLLALLPAAHALDQNDQGEYLLLKPDGEPTRMKMRYYLKGTQWVMDGKTGNENWKPVCQGTGDCRLTAPSNPNHLRSLLPKQWHSYPLTCVENKAFAFCRINEKGNENKRLYWWIALTPRKHALPLNRIVK